MIGPFSINAAPLVSSQTSTLPTHSWRTTQALNIWNLRTPQVPKSQQNNRKGWYFHYDVCHGISASHFTLWTSKQCSKILRKETIPGSVLMDHSGCNWITCAAEISTSVEVISTAQNETNFFMSTIPGSDEFWTSIELPLFLLLFSSQALVSFQFSLCNCLPFIPSFLPSRSYKPILINICTCTESFLQTYYLLTSQMTWCI